MDQCLATLIESNRPRKHTLDEQTKKARMGKYRQPSEFLFAEEYYSVCWICPCVFGPKPPTKICATKMLDAE